MEIRKGPYGHFAINKIEDIDSVHSYTREIVEENIPGHMLPLYIIPAVSRYEVSYDFSGLSPLSILIPENNGQINRLRKALGDLFFSLADLPDYLLSPASVTFDERFIFSDENYEELKVCFNPVKVDPSSLNIHSLSRTALPDFLNSPSVSKALKPDEVDGILYAVEQNDSDLLKQESEKIKEPVTEPKEESKLLNLNEFKAVILAGLLSLIFSLTGIWPGVWVSITAEIFFAVKTYKIIRNNDKTVIPVSSDETKKQMLFGKDENSNGGIDALILSSQDPLTGETEKKAIYTDRATIGSDRFLCDIFSADKEISPVHVEIRKTGRTYYVSDLSADNTTFLNNIRLEPGREYEIKSDQTLMIGKREYNIQII